jgi:uncharacterized integral membrane protein
MRSATLLLLAALLLAAFAQQNPDQVDLTLIQVTTKPNENSS